MATTSEQVSLFVVLGDAYDVAASSLSGAIKISVALPLSDGLSPGPSLEYADRSELLRRESAFESTALLSDEVSDLTSAARQSLRSVVRFVEDVCVQSLL